MEKYDIAIIGGGASGLAAAISAQTAKTCRVVILERQPRVGKKLLATGNGRCNILNSLACPDSYFGSKALVKPALSAFTYAEALRFFKTAGLEIVRQENGCCYPMSNQAASVLDCLRLTNHALGAKETTEFDVSRINREKGGFILCSSNGESIYAKRVIIAAGSMAQPKLGGGGFFKTLLQPLGHTFTPCLPALSQIKTAPEDIAGLKGQKYQGKIALYDGETEIASETGEILFTENGVSGIAAMQLTLHATSLIQKKHRLYVSMAPLSMTAHEACEYISKRAHSLSDRTLEDFLTGVLAKRIGQLLLKRAGIQPLSRSVSSLTSREIQALARYLTDWRIPVTGLGGFDSAQVMLGGVKANEFIPETLESRLVKGVYACGELMDVTGPCGGYNLTWAWASGILAGRSAAESI